MALVIEDGTGVEGANAFQSVAATESQLGELGYVGFVGLADDAEKTGVLIQASKAVSRSLSSAPEGVPASSLQGLYFPRSCEGARLNPDSSVAAGSAYAVPPDALLAASLKAELIALTDPRFSTVLAGGVPEGVTEVTLAKGVSVKTNGQRVDATETVRGLRAQLADVILSLMPGADL